MLIVHLQGAAVQGGDVIHKAVFATVVAHWSLPRQNFLLAFGPEVV